MKRYLIGSPRAMRALAVRIGRTVHRSRRARKRATVIALEGELGVGKTLFAKAFAAVFHVKHRMPSPTFLIARSYPIPAFRARVPYRRLFHVDLYRISSARELTAIGWNRIVENPEHLVLIEWADLLPRLISRNAIWVRIRHGRKRNERSVATRTPWW